MAGGVIIQWDIFCSRKSLGTIGIFGKLTEKCQYRMEHSGYCYLPFVEVDKYSKRKKLKSQILSYNYIILQVKYA